MISVYYFVFKNQCSNKSNRFHLKMESDEETVAAMVALPMAKRYEKEKKICVGKTLAEE